jgi:hypothetical protein
MQTYFKNNFIKLTYNKDARLGKAVWNGNLHGSELREAYLLCVELIDRFALTRWLADDRQMKSIAPADLKWSMQHYVPRMAKSSLLRMARLPSFCKDNLISVDAMIEKGLAFDLGIAVRDFTDEQEAINWLMGPL